MLPRGAEIIPNSEGVSPGFACESKETVFYFLPGVPREFKSMFTGAVAPDIVKRTGGAGGFSIKTVSVFGIAESEIAEKTQALDLGEADVAYRIKGREIQVRVSHPRDPEIVGKAANRIAECLGENVFSTSGASIEETVAEALRKKGMTIAVAESCTGRDAGVPSYRYGGKFGIFSRRSGRIFKRIKNRGSGNSRRNH